MRQGELDHQLNERMSLDVLTKRCEKAAFVSLKWAYANAPVMRARRYFGDRQDGPAVIAAMRISPAINRPRSAIRCSRIFSCGPSNHGSKLLQV
jgi:hypothetical protein